MKTFEAWRPERATYPFAIAVETRFQDLDTLGHINNVAMGAIFEMGRVGFNRSCGVSRERRPDERWLIARVAIDYLAEAHFPEAVEVASGVGRIGGSSWTVLSAGFQSGRCVALCETVLVLTGKEGKRALPDDLRERLANFALPI